MKNKTWEKWYLKHRFDKNYVRYKMKHQRKFRLEHPEYQIEYNAKRREEYNKLKGGEKMRTIKHYTAVTKRDFDLVKALYDAKVSRVKIAQISGRSYFTVTWLVKATSFEDYVSLIKAYSLKEKEKYDKKEKPVVELYKGLPPTENGVKYTDSNAELIITLRLINHNLERLAEAWEAHPQISGAGASGNSFLNKLTGHGQA